MKTIKKLYYNILLKICGVLLAIGAYILIKKTTKITYHKIDYEIKNKS